LPVNAQYLEANRQVQWFVENVSQNIPLGAASAIALLNREFRSSTLPMKTRKKPGTRRSTWEKAI
jgi:hypothetical protein